MTFNNIYSGKTVLITGHTGFKGSWLTTWLLELGASVVGYSHPEPPTHPSNFVTSGLAGHITDVRGDIRNYDHLLKTITDHRPEIIFHLAAQPIVLRSVELPKLTIDTNTGGTVNVLEAIRHADSVRALVSITTDKVYENQEWLWGYRETDQMGGHDPYSASKAAAELVAASYRDAFLRAAGVAVATARAGNVIGGGDWSEDRLVPDAVRAWLSGRTLSLRHPQAIRPWQHVLDPLAGYLRLAERLWDEPGLAGAWNFGPQTCEAASVRDVVELARRSFGRGEWQAADATGEPHEAGWLALEVAQARSRLGVSPRWPLATAVERTMTWYRAWAEGTDARALCEADIARWEAAA